MSFRYLDNISNNSKIIGAINSIAGAKKAGRLFKIFLPISLNSMKIKTKILEFIRPLQNIMIEKYNNFKQIDFNK